jgi:hypothetical protein
MAKERNLYDFIMIGFRINKKRIEYNVAGSKIIPKKVKES